MSALPQGMSTRSADEVCSFRDPEVTGVECEADILAVFNAAPFNSQGRAQLVCSWCGRTHRGRLDSTLAWFHEHPCSTQYAEDNERRLAA